MAVCCRAAAENLMLYRAKENACLYGAVKSLDIHLSDHISVTIDRLGNSHLSNEALSVIHEDIMIDILRKAMIRYQEEEAYANLVKRNLILLDLIRYREILYSQNSN